MHHDTLTPDIETSSDQYARRFDGAVGRFFLEVQAELVSSLLRPPDCRGLRALDVGGGHGQLTGLLLDRGFDVWVQGSASCCRDRILPFERQFGDRVHFVGSSFWSLPFPDRHFDLVIGVRLLAHVERWKKALAEMARVCRRQIIVDFPPLANLSLLDPILVRLKTRVEGRTRPYFRYATHSLTSELRRSGFGAFAVRRQLFVPMVVHRGLARRGLSEGMERTSRALGLTALLGAPALLAAERLGDEDGR